MITYSKHRRCFQSNRRTQLFLLTPSVKAFCHSFLVTLSSLQEIQQSISALRRDKRFSSVSAFSSATKVPKVCGRCFAVYPPPAPRTLPGGSTDPGQFTVRVFGARSKPQATGVMPPPARATRVCAVKLICVLTG